MDPPSAGMGASVFAGAGGSAGGLLEQMAGAGAVQAHAGSGAAGGGVYTNAAGAAAGDAAIVTAGTGDAAGSGSAAAGVGGVGGAAALAGAGGGAVAGAGGSTGQAGAAGAPPPTVHELWTITQHSDVDISTVDDPQSVTVQLDPSPGAQSSTSLSWGFGRNDTVEHTFTAIPGYTTVEVAYLNRGAFRSSWNVDGAYTTGPVTAETPAHVTYVHLVASSKLSGHVEAWSLTVDVSWTAYGY